jgi:hypothetical protein
MYTKHITLAQHLAEHIPKTCTNIMHTSEKSGGGVGCDFMRFLNFFAHHKHLSKHTLSDLVVPKLALNTRNLLT